MAAPTSPDGPGSDGFGSPEGLGAPTLPDSPVLPLMDWSFMPTTVGSNALASSTLDRVYPDNRPVVKRTFRTEAHTLDVGELDRRFKALYQPNPDVCYTVKDWRRAEMYAAIKSRRRDGSHVSPRGHAKAGLKERMTTSTYRLAVPRPPSAKHQASRRSRRHASRRASPRAKRASKAAGMTRSEDPSMNPVELASVAAVVGKGRGDGQVKPGFPVDAFEAMARKLAAAGRIAESLDFQLHAIEECRKNYGLSSQRIRLCCERFLTICNESAMKVVARQPLLAQEILERGLVVSRKGGPMARHSNTRRFVRAATLSNLGCCYKARREYGRALGFLKRAAQLEIHCTLCKSPVNTYVNICSVLSSMGRHVSALEYANAALQFIRMQGAPHPETESHEDEKSGSPQHDFGPDGISMYGTVMHNKAVELMWLFRHEEAREVFEEALEALQRVVRAGTGDVREALLQGLEHTNRILRGEDLAQQRLEKRRKEEQREIEEKKL